MNAGKNNKEANKEYIEKLYKNVAERTVKMLEKEKAIKVSKRTQKMIALTRTLYYDTCC